MGLSACAEDPGPICGGRREVNTVFWLGDVRTDVKKSDHSLKRIVNVSYAHGRGGFLFCPLRRNKLRRSGSMIYDRKRS